MIEIRRLGRRQRLSGHWGRRTFEIDQTITAYQSSSSLTWKHDAEWLDGKPAPRISRDVEFTIRISSEPAGTRVQLISRHEPASAFRGVLFRVVAAPRVAKMLEGSLARLATLGG